LKAPQQEPSTFRFVRFFSIKTAPFVLVDFAGTTAFGLSASFVKRRQLAPQLSTNIPKFGVRYRSLATKKRTVGNPPSSCRQKRLVRMPAFEILPTQRKFL
jgi:hypothetical protein